MRENRELRINPSNTELPWISHLLLICSLTLHTFSHKSLWLFFPSVSQKKKNVYTGVGPTLTGGAGALWAEAAAAAAAFPATWRGPAPPALTDRCASTWACRCCWPAPTRWPSSATWARRTSPRACGWAWSCAAPKARTTARWAAAATSPAGPATACWSGPAASRTAASTGHAWWTRTAEDGRSQEEFEMFLLFCSCFTQSESFDTVFFLFDLSVIDFPLCFLCALQRRCEL